MKDRAVAILRQALGRTDADFRDGQWDAIAGLLERRRLLVVQRTGWGKSMVYFVATRMLRDDGRGFSLIVSPLLSLMRNQLEAAARIGIRAETINSTNTEDWDAVVDRIASDEIDLLLVSPERLANDDFVQRVLSPHAARVGLLAVDEAHCISDWGHDFRPDYRRIAGIIAALPSNVPIVATTATANDRVVDDVRRQLGEHVEVVRGPLARSSIRLQTLSIPSAAGRMAWLAEHLPRLAGSGIVYTLTTRDADRLAEWLRLNGVDAEAYHAGIETGNRESLEQRLLRNDLKVLVATTALGMGFDKPDLGFVVHFQRPGSVIHYYQQVGRAGRALADAYGILLHGAEDDQIVEWFQRTAFPPQRNVRAILDAIADSPEGLLLSEIHAAANLRKGEVDKTLKFLSLESPSPIVKVERRWRATAAARRYRLDEERIESITQIRRDEQEEMRRYMEHRGCLMEFLSQCLDDPGAKACGRCARCCGAPLVPETFERERAVAATTFLRRSHQTIQPRKQWPSGVPLSNPAFRGRIAPDLLAEPGRALCLWRDAGWGEQVANDKQAERFDDALVAACVEMLASWRPEPPPAWVACVPSLARPGLVPDFASRLAAALGLPFIPCIRKTRHAEPQKDMLNSVHQIRNIDGAFEVIDPPSAPCLLVDDVVHSGWTLTLTAALLRLAGVSQVHPMVLAQRGADSE